MTTQTLDLEHYMNLPYTEVIRRDEEGDFVARVEELQGCVAHGGTRQEAFDSLRIAMELWITDALERGERIPLPAPDEVLPSGKWVQRVPRRLHLQLAKLAKREDTSLNQLVLSVLSTYVGWTQRPNELERYCSSSVET